MPFQENRFGILHSLFYIFSTTCKTFTHLNTWQMPGVTTTFSLPILLQSYSKLQLITFQTDILSAF